MTVTYSSYLRIEELLSLQQPRSAPAEHDEILFIVIHQVYELWFKQVLHELDRLCLSMRDNRGPEAQRTLRRVLTILKTMVSQVDVLETMSPLEFLSFRDHLASASGFQSSQFRELEMLLGKKSKATLEHHARGSAARARLEIRLGEATLWDAFLAFLAGAGYAVPRSLLERDVTASIEPSAELQELLLDIYRNEPNVAQLCELLVDLDEGLQEWRYRHVKMVERTIGTRQGTGGSAGVG